VANARPRIRFSHRPGVKRLSAGNAAVAIDVDDQDQGSGYAYEMDCGANNGAQDRNYLGTVRWVPPSVPLVHKRVLTG
jgi:hypothetical protein